MTVESASYISQLNTALPSGSDAKAEGDDHLRLVKSVLKAQFPNFGAAALNASITQLDKAVTSVVVNASAPAGAIVIDASGYVYVNGALGLGVTGIYRHQTNGSYLAYGDSNGYRALNTASNGAVSLTANTGAGGGGTLTGEGGPLVFQTNSATRVTIDSSGNTISTVNTAAPGLSANQTMAFSLPSNSTLRVSVRGSDGTTRTADLALA